MAEMALMIKAALQDQTLRGTAEMLVLLAFLLHTSKMRCQAVCVPL